MGTRSVVSRTQLGGMLLLSWLVVSVGFLVFFYLGRRDAGVLITGQTFWLATVASFVAASLALAFLCDAVGLRRGTGAIVGLLYGATLYGLSRNRQLIENLARVEYTVLVPGMPVLSFGTVTVVPTVAVLLGWLLLWRSDASFRSLGNGHIGLGSSAYTIALLAVLYLPLQVFLFGFIQFVGWDCVVGYLCVSAPGLYGTTVFTAMGHVVALVLSLPGLVSSVRALSGHSTDTARSSATTGRESTSIGGYILSWTIRLSIGILALFNSYAFAVLATGQLGYYITFGYLPSAILPRFLAFFLGALAAQFGVYRAAKQLRGAGNSAPSGAEVTEQGGPDDWPQPRHDPAKTAAVPDEPGPAAAPGTAWQTLPETGRIATAPAVAHGVALAVTDDCELVAIDASTGDLEWTAALDGESPTPAAVTSRVAYVGTDAGLHAHRISDGEHRWSEAVGPVETLAAGDVVYAGTDDGVTALRPATGSRKWTADLDEAVRDVAVGDEAVYAATGSSVVALSAATGAEQWRADAPDRRSGLAVGPVVVAAGRAGVVAFDPGTGDEQWRDGTRCDHAAVALAHGRVYQATDTAVRALDDEVGAETWQTPIDTTTAPVVVGDTVYVGTTTELVALDATERDSYAFAHECEGVQSAPAVAGNALFCSTADGALTVVTGQVATETTLAETTTTVASDEVATPADDEADEPARAEETATETDGDSGGTASGNRLSVADRFARDCGAVTAASVVDETGPVHVYDGQFVDDVGEVDARVYALAPAHADHEQACGAFLDAAREWQGIGKNTHVATVFGTGSDPRPWVAFDAGTGRLDDALEGLDRQERRQIVDDLAEAIRTAGMYNIVHGGIDPETVYLVDDDLEGQTAALADWGLHRAVADAIGGEVEVTPYIAPEQLDGETAGTRTDIYRLGALATYTLTGEPPFADTADLSAAIRDADRSITEMHDDALAPAVATAIREATARHPDERTASAYAFKQELLATEE